MSGKTVYQCDEQGWYLHETIADESPLEPGVFHIPRGCVEAPPPAVVEAGHRPRWVGGKWRVQAVPKPAAPTKEESLAKLAAFLAENPDVLEHVENFRSEQGGV